MKMPLPLLLASLILFFKANISAQSTCDTSIPICSGLNGFSETLPNGNIQQPFSGCGGNVLNNPLWFSFVAGTSAISIEVFPSNCIGLNGQFGMQASIYSDCAGINLAAQCNCTDDQFVLVSDQFIIGKTYFLVLDGCNGDVCDFTLEVLSGSTIPPAIFQASITGPDTLPIDLNNFTATYSATGGDDFVWSTVPPEAGSFTNGPTGSTVEIAWVEPTSSSIAQLCVVPSNICTVGLQTCLTIYLDTAQFVPNYHGLIATEAPPVQLDSSLTDLCLGDTLHLTGFTLVDGDTVQDDAGFIYTWTFDENEMLMGKTVAFAFAEPGFHKVEMMVTIPPGFEAVANAVENIFVIQTPSITVTGVPTSSICLGTEITLTALAASDTITLLQPLISIDTFPQGIPVPDGSGITLEIPIQHVGSNPGDVLATVDSFSICVNMEHSWMRDLEIKITCPNGQSAILHNHPGQLGGEVWLGEPIHTDEGMPILIPGIGYDYCWTANAPNPTWIQYANVNQPETLPAGEYASFEPLSNLLGCPLDGEWILSFTDLWNVDNGHVFSVGIKTLTPDTQVFILNASPVWQPDSSITAYSSGTISAAPDSSVVYHLVVTDNAGCGYELSFPVEVLPVGNPACLPCDSLTVELEDILLTCSTSSLPITVEAVVSLSGNFMDYVWLINGDTVSTTPTVVIGMLGEYIFIATNTVTGCSVSDTLLFIEDIELPFAEAGPDLEILCQPVILDGTASSTGPDFTYAWFNQNGVLLSNEITATTAEPGVYTLVVTDQTNDCTSSDEVFVSTSPIDPVGGTTPDSCNLGIGSAFVLFPFTDATYLWSTGDTTSAIEGLFSGGYGVTVNWMGCNWTALFVVDSIICTAVLERLPGLSEVKISPNPNNGHFTLELVLAETMPLEFSVMDMLGREVWQMGPVEKFSAGQHLLRFEVDDLNVGDYFLKIKAQSGHGLWKFVKVE